MDKLISINFIVNPIRINGGFSPWDRRVGGSEEMVIETSTELVKRGHKVKVFHNGRHGEYKGVEYRERDDFEPGDVTINMNYPKFKAGGKSILWTSLVDHPVLSHFDAVCTISQYAKDNTNIHHDNVFIVPPGYHNDKIYPKDKVKKQCLYASSPDRGLSTLELIWPSVVEEHPDAHLYVTYGGQIHTPNTTCGEFTEGEMNELFNTSDIWIHPASQGELYCMSGVKAQVAGAIPVYFPTMALAETVKAGEKCTDARDIYAKLVSLLGDEDRKDQYRKELSVLKYPTWEDSTDRLLEIIKGVL